MKLKLKKLNLNYKVFTETDIYLGTFQMDWDGLYYFWKDKDLYGAETSYSLRLIADKLDEVNKPFQDVINKDLKEVFYKYRKCKNHPHANTYKGSTGKLCCIDCLKVIE